jgi:PAS domain S-box-containing protein
MQENQHTEEDLKKRLEEEAARWQLVLDANNDAIFDWDIQQGTMFRSPRWKQMLGYGASDLPEAHDLWTEQVHPKDLESVREKLEAHLRRETEYYFAEYRVRAKDGSYRWILDRGRAVWDESGRAIRLVGSHTDIDRLKKTEEQLRKSEEFLAAVVQNSNELITIVDSRGVVLFHNNAIEKVLGYKAEDRVGKSVLELVYPEDLPAAKATMADILVKPASSVTIRFRHADGSIRYLEALGTNLIENPSVRGIVIHSRDVTAAKDAEAKLRRQSEELAKAKEQAEAAARAKTEFLAMMSHEIRTPMNGVIGMTNLLQDTALDVRQREYLSVIRSSGEALLDIINDILDFSKIEAGRMEIEAVDFKLATVVGEAAEMVSQAAHSKNLELIVSLDNRLPENVNGDPGRLRQVLLNLLSNAVKFTERGDITVRVALHSRSRQAIFIHFSVADTGVGIDEIARKRLFQEFSQGDASTRRRFGGTGLGLVISRRLVELMGGEIGFDSVESQGTTFWFTVRMEPRGGIAHDPRIGRGKRILVTDDNQTNRIILEEMLSKMGAEVVCADSAEEALRAIERAESSGSRFDLAILDYQMPLVDGLMLARKLRADPRLASLKLVLLTSAVPPGLAAEAKAANIASVLTKPPRREVFVNNIASLLNQSERVVKEKGFADPMPAESPRFSGHVLLVEDNAANQKVATLMLQRLGLRVSIAGNGVEAVAAFRACKYDLILMDHQMPEMDGIEATHRIRRMEGSGRHTPIVALTANVLSGQREECMAAKMDDFLAKPIRSAELSEKLALWLPGPPAPEISDHDPETRRLSEEVRAFIAEVYSDLNRADMQDFFEILERTTLPTLEQFERELSAGELEAAARTLHQLRNSAGAAGAAELSESLLAMEKSLRGGVAAEANERLPHIRVSCHALTTVLKQIARERAD